MRRVAAIIIGSLLPLSFTAVAAAQTPPTPTPTPPPPAPTPTPTPPPAPAPAAGAMSLKLERVHRLGHDQVVLRGDKLRVRGTVAPFVAGQRVTVRLYKGRSKLAAKSVLVKPAGPNGTFLVSLKPGKGRLTVRASHRATPQQVTFIAKAKRVIGVTPFAAPGSSGPAVRLLQSRLAKLRYAVARSGHFDASTGRAVVAYRKMRGWSRIGVASRDVMRGLVAGKGALQGEVPRARQARRGRPLAPGAGAAPRPQGRPHLHDVVGQEPRRRRCSAASRSTSARSAPTRSGWCTRATSSAATRSTATTYVPTFPASHGCLRVPVPNAFSIYNWLRIGDRVDVYP